jgi:hypothetical protein
MLASFIAAGKNWSESGRRVSVRRLSVPVSVVQLPVEEGSRASFDRSRSPYRAFTVAGSADKKRSLIEDEDENDLGKIASPRSRDGEQVPSDQEP